VGAAGQDDGGLPAADTLIGILSACEDLLADEEWLASRPDGWADQLLAIRNRLQGQLEEHARRYRDASPGG
jgi:hypothetical protein